MTVVLEMSDERWSAGRETIRGILEEWSSGQAHRFSVYARDSRTCSS